MILNPFICVFLMSCFSSKEPLNNYEKCPDYCQCYPAPEGGDGADTAITLVCDWNTKTNPLNDDKYKLLSTEKINSFVIENIDNMEKIPPNMLSGLTVNNLVFRDCALFNIDNKLDVLSGLDQENLKVLTFINTVFVGGKYSINWDTFKYMNKLKAIHLNGGELPIFGAIADKLQVGNIISLTIDNTKLINFLKDVFKKFTKLKMLKITNNPIETIDWLNEIDSPLWYLDLRNNQIKSFPLEVAKKLTRLRTLKLGGNNIHVISYETAEILINRLGEFSFEKIEEQNVKRKEYFYPAKDMRWINQLMDDKHPSKFTRSPRFLYESLFNYQCIIWNKPAFKSCIIIPEHGFNYPLPATTENVATYQRDLSYQNELFMFSGAVLPYNWEENKPDKINQLTKWLDKFNDASGSKGNVVKIHLAMNEWFSINKNDPTIFNEMISELKEYLNLAQQKNIFIIINLWKSEHLPKEFLNEIILEDYLEKHLKPLVQALNKYKSLAAWNLIDAPENLVEVNKDGGGDRCLDTKHIQRISSGTGRYLFPIRTFQHFLAKQAQIIHNIEPRKLVTLAMHEINALNKNVPGFNNFQTRCMKTVMDGVCPNDDCALDFYSVIIEGDGTNTVAFNPDTISAESPKPIVIIVETHDYLKGVVENYITKGWEGVGILGSFTKNPDDPANHEIMKEINKFSKNEEKKEFVLDLNFKNSIL